MPTFLPRLTVAICLLAAPVLAQRVILVDDDGAQCPGAMRYIQEAVSAATPGTTILVCPGTYPGTVYIEGSQKNGLRLLAVGPAEGVVIRGDFTECDGIHLIDVDGVLIRGFTVTGFGCPDTPPTRSQFGAGADIRLTNSNFNTIEYNRLSNNWMFGIRATPGARADNNVLQYNEIFAIDQNGFGCGIMLGGGGGFHANNLIRGNKIYDTPGAGIMVNDAGRGNMVVGNDLFNNGRYGIDNRTSNGTLIFGNRVVNSPGYWSTSPAGAPGSLDARGLNVGASVGLTIRLNEITGNAGLDVVWDGSGDNTFEANSCGAANQPRLCARQVGCAAGSRCAAVEKGWPNYDMM